MNTIFVDPFLDFIGNYSYKITMICSEQPDNSLVLW